MTLVGTATVNIENLYLVLIENFGISRLSMFRQRFIFGSGSRANPGVGFGYKFSAAI